MGAVASLALGFCSGAGGAITSVFGFAGAAGASILTGLVFLGEFIISLAGYVFSCFGVAFACFTGVCARMTTEIIRPVTDWQGSEASKLARGGSGCWRVCCSCCAVVSCIFVATLLIAYLMTLTWYELEAEV